MGKHNSLYLWMEDFDNAELSESDRKDQLEEAVRVYNSEHGTDYSPRASVIAYERWVKEQNEPDK